MRLTTIEIGSVALIIGYVAFFTHPPPAHLQNFLDTPAGKITALLVVLYVTVYHSFITGLFLGIAYVMTVQSVTEYLDEKEQTPPKKTSNVPEPQISNVLKSMLTKGDTRLPQATGKSNTVKPVSILPPKATSQKSVENFASF